MATARSAANYASAYDNLYLQNRPDQFKGKVEIRVIDVVIVSAAATGDTYKVAKLRAYERLVGVNIVTNTLGASAGSCTIKLGDGTTDNLFVTAATGIIDVLNATGQGYTPTADVDVVLTITGTPVVGKTIKGYLLIVPARV